MKLLKKPLALPAFLLAGALGLTGCAQPTATPAKPIDPSASASVPSQTPAAPEPAAPSPAPAKTSPADPAGSALAKPPKEELKELAFTYQGQPIFLFDLIQDDQALEKVLGKAQAIESHTYSPDDGLNMDPLNGFTEKRYQYPGLLLKTINAREDHKYFIHQIKITDPRYETVSGVKVGDSFEKLQTAYPKGKLTGGELTNAKNDFRYEPIDYVNHINVTLEDKKVTSILISTLLD